MTNEERMEQTEQAILQWAMASVDHFTKNKLGGGAYRVTHDNLMNLYVSGLMQAAGTLVEVPEKSRAAAVEWLKAAIESVAKKAGAKMAMYSTNLSGEN